MNDLRLMRHFEAVYRLRSFSNAAEELRLTHSALTKSIKALEQDWDVKLFHRTTRTIVPTEAGKRLYPMAVDLISFARNVRIKTRGGDHRLQIICGPAILDSLVQPAIIQFADRYADTQITVETMPPNLAAEELVQRRIHLLLYHEATLRQLPYFDRLRIRKIIDEPYYMVFRPGHPVTATSQRIEDIVKFDWAIAGYDNLFEMSLPAELQSLLKSHRFPKYRLLSQSACIDLATRSDILTAVPKSVAAPLIDNGILQGITHPGNIRFSVNSAVLVDAAAEPTVNHFIDCLQSGKH